MRWLMVLVVVVGETLGGPVAVPAPFPAGNFLSWAFKAEGPFFEAKMIIRQENEPNNGSVWRRAIMVFRKPFNVLLLLKYSFS